MTNFVLLACWALPMLVFGRSATQTLRGILCEPVSTTKLKMRLDRYGGLNKDIVAFDRHSASKNLEKAVVRSNVRSQIRLEINRKRGMHGMKFTPQSNGKLRPTHDFAKKAHFERPLSSDSSNCLEKGSLTANGNLNLCKKCTVSTTLPSDRFPRFITETVCSSSNALDGQGACVERSISMTFLKKSTKCVANADGTFTEGWEHYTQNVRVGCECEIRKGSYLTPLVSL